MAERGQGFKYQFSVTAYLASLLSKNENVTNYHIFYERDEVAPFDDIVVAVNYKQSEDVQLYLIQAKSGKDKLDAGKYLKGYKKIMKDKPWKFLKNIGKITENNIHLWYIISKNVPHDSVPLKEDTITIDLEIKRRICDDNKFVDHKDVYELFTVDEEITSKYQHFFDTFYIFLEYPDTKTLTNRLRGMWALNDPAQIIEYLDKYFTKSKGALSKTTFEHELLKIRLSNYIVTPTKVIPIKNELADAWNELTLSHNVTIVNNELDIEKYLFGCMLQRISNTVTIDQWNTFVDSEGKLPTEIKNKFKSEPIKPETLTELMIHLWICRQVPLILKTESALPVLKDFSHLQQNYLVIDSNLDKRYNEIKSYNMSAMKDLSSTKTDTLLQFILVSIQGRKPVSLYSIINGDSKLKATLTCSCIVKLMKPREVYLKHECLESSNYMFFIIETQILEPHNYEDYQPTGDNILVHCQVNESEEYFHHVTMDPKFKSYKVVRLQMIANRLTLLWNGSRNGLKPDMSRNEGEAFPKYTPDKEYRGLEYYFIDQNGETVYNMGLNDPVPVIGEVINTSCSRYVPRRLRKGITVQKHDTSIIEYSGPLFSEEDFFQEMRSKIVVVTGEPGIGKTTLLKSLYGNCQPLYYVVFRDFARYQVYIRQKNQNLLKNPLEFLCNNKDLLPYQEFLKVFCSNGKRIILILDSFDEIIETYKMQALRLIKQLNNEECLEKIIVGSRLITVALLSSELKVDIAKIEGLNNEHNNHYIDNWGLDNKHLQNMPPEFLASPLYLNILRTISENQRSLEIVNRWTLYESIVNLKIERYCLRITPYCLDDSEKDNILIYHWQLALKVLFGNNQVTQKMAKRQRKFSNYLRLGLITSYDDNEDPIFIHRTFAEYFLTQWLIENALEEDARFIYQEMLRYEGKIGFERGISLLDIYCEQFPMYKAVLNQDLIELENLCISNKGYLTEVDAIGRMAIHIAAIYCKIHSDQGNRYRILDTIIQHMRQEEYDMYARDSIMNWNWIAYLPYEKLKRTTIGIQEAYWHYHALSVDDLRAHPLPKSFNTVFTESYNFAVSYSSISVIRDLLFLKYHKTEDFRKFHVACVERVTEYPKYFKLPEENLTTLHLACIYSNMSIVKACIDRGDNINEVDAYNCTPLHYSVCDDRNTKIVELLIDKGANAHAKGGKEFTSAALHLSATAGAIEITKTLLKTLDINFKDKNGFTPFHLATKFNKVAMMEMLLKNNADVNTVNHDLDAPLHTAVQNECKDAVRILLEYKSDINNINNSGKTPLYLAIELNTVGIAEMLLKQRADVNKVTVQFKTPLCHAIVRGSKTKDMVELLLKYFADVHLESPEGMTALYLATVRGNVEVIEMLLRNGTNINQVNKHGFTSLDAAIAIGQCSTVQILLNNQADVNFRDKDRSTPLYKAVGAMNKEMVEILLKNGAYLHCVNKFGFTPLVTAVEEGNATAVEILLKNGADVNFKTESDITPLYVAALTRNIDIIALLLEYGADVDVITKSSEILPKAVERKNYNIIAWLVKKYMLRLSKPACSSTVLEQAVHIDKQIEVPTDAVLETALCIALEEENPMSISVINIYSRSNIQLPSRNYINSDEEFRSAYLNFGAKRKSKDLNKILIQNFIKGNFDDIARGNPLCFAAKDNSLISMIMLRNGADPNAKDVDGRTPLLIFIDRNRNINILLTYKPDVNLADHYGTTPLLAAIGKHSIQNVKLLLENGADVNYVKENGVTPLARAASESHLPILQMLLDRNAEVNFADQCGLTALYVAALNGDERILKILLQYGATTDIIIDGNILLRNAIAIGNGHAVELLLKLSSENRTSSSITSEDIVNKVFNNKSNVNLALHLAINAGDIEMVKLVLAYDPKLNEGDENGSTVLHTAVNLNRINIVEMLLKFHVDVLQKNNDNLTPLDYAINNGNDEIIEMLCKYAGFILSNIKAQFLRCNGTRCTGKSV